MALPSYANWTGALEHGEERMHQNETIQQMVLRCVDCGHLNELTYDQGADGEQLGCARCRSRLGTVGAAKHPTRH
ncbi:hypothetical protein SAMN02745157_0009 [Kaistia soli DSM 19436]|uniref:Uncharacterized protein n=2 Tax=Kaistia TaxID=166953 RepID=A0A1M5NVI6_9HYPH|nr:hypothetical protein SAMN02745157_0009 [Kaistia soli DSM 19436]